LFLLDYFDAFIEDCLEAYQAFTPFAVHDSQMEEPCDSCRVIDERFAPFTVFRGWLAIPVNDFGTNRVVSETTLSIHMVKV
jgi:hypothetical protein